METDTETRQVTSFKIRKLSGLTTEDLHVFVLKYNNIYLI